MIQVPISHVDNAIQHFDLDIKKYKQLLKDNLTILSNDKRIRGNKKNYIDHLLKTSGNLITAKQTSISKYKKEFDSIIAPAMMRSKPYEEFKELILKNLGYADRRSDFYPRYFQKVGIKACVYCNSQLAVSVEKQTKLKTKTKFTITAKFQVDHYLPKSEYPCFSISLLNLYPCCGNCNICKSVYKVNFKLYSAAETVIPCAFQFALLKGCVAKYLLRRNTSLIEYNFVEPKAPIYHKTFDDVFQIKGIYDTQKDIAEEIILKAEVYTETYKKALRKKFPKIFTTSDILNRVLVGNYTLEKDIHKRPMSKFMRDVAIDVGLIK